jgi:hypothetical protein
LLQGGKIWETTQPIAKPAYLASLGRVYSHQPVFASFVSLELFFGVIGVMGVVRLRSFPELMQVVQCISCEAARDRKLIEEVE